MTSSSPTFTGRRTRRKTARSVKVAEVLARLFITIGGFGTILAVSTICLFLVWVVLPLFTGSEVEEGPAYPVGSAGAAPIALGMDEQKLMGWALLGDGSVAGFDVRDGTLLGTHALFEGEQPVALQVDPHSGDLAAGFADGSLQFGRLGIGVEFLVGAEPEELADLPLGSAGRWRETMVQRTPEDQLRQHRLQVEVGQRVVPDADHASAVVLVSQIVEGRTNIVAVLHDDGRLTLERVRKRANMLTGEITTSVRTTEVPYSGRPGHGHPTHMLVTDQGADVILAWPDGRALRFDNRGAEPVMAESVDLLAEAGTELTALGLLIGRSTVVAGDSEGTVRGWFLAREDAEASPRMVLGHEIPGGGAAVTALAASPRTRSLAAGTADGRVRLLHMTTDRELGAGATDGGVTALTISPRDDGLVAATGAGLQLWHVQNDHPETAAAALFLPVWYEGENQARHIWQSSSGSDDFEPKLGLFPLVFGTIKATFYSMIFSVPLALLAAVYTSEFLARGVRARVKQAIEMMATLPSVVLGFLAAIVLAPAVERHLPGVLAGLVTVPLCWLLGAHLWQLLPQNRAVRWANWPRFACVALAAVAGMVLAGVVGPRLESTLFGGDLRGWLDGNGGEAFGGWFLMGLPLSGLAAGWASSRWLSPLLAGATAGWSRRSLALVDLCRFLLIVIGALALSAALATLLQALGLDARGGLTVGETDLAPAGTYVQRNALIVGFVMGFAVIPIIYTLAEDALSSVPEHLRAASLATGATPWQTAVRVVVPTAMSGLFSAVMIGLGRAVGETMVVLMAAGNTPLLEANIFNGFRTLSANIAVELPEAVRNGSLYRVLFLAALTLFAMTFVINTFAEVVRMRFRKRAYEL